MAAQNKYTYTTKKTIKKLQRIHKTYIFLTVSSQYFLTFQNAKAYTSVWPIS